MTVVRIDVGDVAITIDPDARMIQIDDGGVPQHDDNAIAPGCAGMADLGPDGDPESVYHDDDTEHPSRMGFPKPC